jgi:hypothetical protein
MTRKLSAQSGKLPDQLVNFSKTIPSHRYMLRYLKAVQMMKKIIEENNLTVMATIARYACAYEAIAKPDWWDKSKRCEYKYRLFYVYLQE